MRILLTGISGGLGSLLAQELERVPEVECITGIDVVPPKQALAAKIQFVNMDVRSPDLVNVMAGHDVVIHTAFVVLWLARMTAAERDDINLNGTRNVAQSAVVNGVRRLIHASSTAAYDPFQMARQTNLTEDFPLGSGTTSFYYSDSKASAERLLHSVLDGSGTHLTLFRPCAIVGPRCQNTIQVLRRTAVNLPRRNPRIQFIHEQDLVAAFLQAVKSDMSGAFNVATDDFIRLDRVWSMMGIRPFLVPTPLMIVAVAVNWKWQGGMIHPYWVEARMADFTASNARLKATGWKPRYNTSEALDSGKDV